MRYLRIAPVLLAGLALVSCPSAGTPKPPENPARLDLAVEPTGLRPGSEARVTLRLVPQDGIKINRYPKIKLAVDGVPGIVGPAETVIGNDAPPPPDRLDENYYDEVDPLVLALQVDANAPAGAHKVPAKLRYFYCVIKSGFCAPKQATVEIPLTVAR